MIYQPWIAPVSSLLWRMKNLVHLFCLPPSFPASLFKFCWWYGYICFFYDLKYDKQTLCSGVWNLANICWLLAMKYEEITFFTIFTSLFLLYPSFSVVVLFQACFIFLFYLIYIFLIWVQLLYYILLVFVVQQRKSAICMHIPLPSRASLPNTPSLACRSLESPKLSSLH